MAQGQYIRIYHTLKDEYPGVWRSDAQLALFVRMLLVAEKWYPEWAPIPKRTPAYRSLVESGLVTENITANGYSIRGLNKERAQRSKHGKHAASMRWASSEHAQLMPSKEEKRREGEQSSEHDLPATFMTHRPKPGEHRGQHENCVVCEAMP